MSLAFKIASFMMAFSIAVSLVNATGIFNGLGAGFERMPENRIWEVWRSVIPKGSDAQGISGVNIAFRTPIVLVLGGIVLIMLMLWSMVGGTMLSMVLYLGFPAIIGVTLQMIVYWSYWALLAEWKSGRQIRGMY